MTPTIDDLIGKLKEWGQRETGEQRAAIAELRRGLQEFPQTAEYMHRYVGPYAVQLRGWNREAAYLTSALFARYHSGSTEPKYSDNGNLGTHFTRLFTPNPDDNTAIERRFNVLLTAHPDDLHFHLRQAITFLHSQSETTIPINWLGLYWDICNWKDDLKRPKVQDEWASAFWSAKYKAENPKPQPAKK